MRSHSSGAPGAPSPEILRRARVQAAGVAPWLAVALADIAFPAAKRDDVSALASLTAHRTASARAVRQ